MEFGLNGLKPIEFLDVRNGQCLARQSFTASTNASSDLIDSNQTLIFLHFGPLQWDGLVYKFPTSRDSRAAA